MPTAAEHSSLPHPEPHALSRPTTAPLGLTCTEPIGAHARLAGGLLIVVLLLLYAPMFHALSGIWMTRADYSHGVLVPLISGYLMAIAWKTRPPAPPITPAPVIGLSLIFLALGALFIGTAGGIITLSSLSFIGMSVGLVLLLFGVDGFRRTALPLGYLIFMTPSLDVLVDPLHSPFQLSAAAVVGALFSFAGVPTYTTGTTVHFPNGALDVVVPCSGASFLISILAIGLPLGALVLRTWPYRIALIVAGLAFSIVANWIRIALMGWLGYRGGWGPQVHGPFHLLQGVLVYWVGLVALFIVAWVLARREHRKSPPIRSSLPLPSAPRFALMQAVPRRNRGAALITLTVAAFYLYTYDRGPVDTERDLDSFPYTVGEWMADETGEAAPVVRLAQVDHELIRLYRRPDGTAIRLYVAYFAAQTQGKELVGHLSAPLHQDTEASILTVDGTRAPVNEGFFQEHRTRTPIVFWYAQYGRSMTDRYRTKADTVRHALQGHGSHGALVLLSGSRVRDNQTAAADHVRQFAHDAWPILRAYVP